MMQAFFYNATISRQSGLERFNSFSEKLTKHLPAQAHENKCILNSVQLFSL